MPRTFSGDYSLPSGTFVSTGDTLLPSQHNPPMTDIATALTNSLDRGGKGGMLAALAMNSNRVTGMGPAVSAGDAVNLGQLAADSGAALIGSSTGTVQDELNSSISLDPTEIVSVTVDTILGPTGLNRFVAVSGSAMAIALAMPAVTNTNIGDCVMISVARDFPGLVTCAGYPASGNLFGEAPNRVLHAGEVALVRFTGSGWTKVTGISRPFVGQISQSAEASVTFASSIDGTSWKRVPLGAPDADNEPSQPWFSTDHFIAIRQGVYQIDLEFWVSGLAMAAPTYNTAALAGTEQGAPIDLGMANAYDVTATASAFGRSIVHYGQTFTQLQRSFQVSSAAGQHFGATARLADATLTGATIAYTNAQVLSRLKFQEVAPW